MIEEVLYQYLLVNVAEVEGRIYPQIAKDNCPTPYIVYTIVNDADKLSRAKSRAVAYTEYRVQIDIYHSSSLKAKKLKNRTKEVLYTLPSRPDALFARESYESATKLYRQMIDFKIKTGVENGCN